MGGVAGTIPVLAQRASTEDHRVPALSRLVAVRIGRCHISK